MTAVILGVVAAGLLIIGKWDRPLPLKGRSYIAILAGAVLEVCIIVYLTMDRPIRDRFLLSAIGGCLLLACITDVILCQVYNFTWWIGLTAALALLWFNRDASGSGEMLQSLTFFLLLQLVLFRRMYGKADCYAFCVCAVAGAAGGMKATGFLTHMLLAYTLLLPIQAARGNINKKGNLKQPVPFLPYITVSFWITITYFC